MELSLTRKVGTEVAVECDGQFSHAFDLGELPALNNPAGLHPFTDPVAYGKALYKVMFPEGSLVLKALDTRPNRIMLVTTDLMLHEVAWEYMCGASGFLVQEFQFVRGVSKEARITRPATDESELHIIAVPSNPLDESVPALNIAGEWMQLKEEILRIRSSVKLERTFPPTIETLRDLVAEQENVVVHFMGHGALDAAGALLYFENEDGSLHKITASNFVTRVRGAVYLVALGACSSANPGPTNFSNLAAALVERKTPYALGMRFIVMDEDSRNFSKSLYRELAAGSSVEEAVLQARLTLADSERAWAVGVPVLYTSLEEPGSVFKRARGTPVVIEHQNKLELDAIPPPDRIFVGRVKELSEIGRLLADESAQQLITIHGGAGVGKTSLARQAAERFSHISTGGVWATSLQSVPARATFLKQLASFILEKDAEAGDADELEREVTELLNGQRVLIILDGAERLIEGREAQEANALELYELLHRLLSRTQLRIVATSSRLFEWPEEVGAEIGGLSSADGARLFRLCAPQRAGEVENVPAQELSRNFDGHPVLLRQLGGLFNRGTETLRVFAGKSEELLLECWQKGDALCERVAEAVGRLDASLRALLQGLAVFHAPFRAEEAETVVSSNSIESALLTLNRLGLLEREVLTFGDRNEIFYRLSWPVRVYAEKYPAEPDQQKELLARFTSTYAKLSARLYDERERSGDVSVLSRMFERDFARCASLLNDAESARFKLHYACLTRRIGDARKANALLEEVLEEAQGVDPVLEFAALENLATFVNDTGDPRKALTLWSQALGVARKSANKRAEAKALNGMGHTNVHLRQSQQAEQHFNDALKLAREIKSEEEEAYALSGMGNVYINMDEPKKARALLEQSLSMMQKLGTRLWESGVLGSLAGVQSRIGNLHEALRLNNESLYIIREFNDRDREMYITANLGSVYLGLGEQQKAIELCEASLKIAEELGNRAQEARALGYIAQARTGTAHLQEVFGLYEQGLSIAREINDTPLQIQLLGGLAQFHQSLGQSELALDNYQAALTLSQNSEDSVSRLSLLYNIGRVYAWIGEPQEGLEYHRKALKLLDTMDKVDVASLAPVRVEDFGSAAGVGAVGAAGVGAAGGVGAPSAATLTQGVVGMVGASDQIWAAAISQGAAQCYQTLGQFKEALELFDRSVHQARSLDFSYGEAESLASKAELYLAIGQSQKAIELLTEALRVVGSFGSKLNEVFVLSRLGLAASASGQPKLALNHIEKGITIARSSGFHSWEAWLIYLKGDVYRQFGQPQKALDAFEQALLLMHQSREQNNESNALMHLGMLHQMLSQPQKALDSFREARTLAREFGSPIVEAVALVNIGNTYSDNLGDYKQALDAFEQALQLFRKSGGRFTELWVMQLMVKLYQVMGQTERVTELYEQMHGIARQSGSKLWEAQTLIQEGETYQEYGETRRALTLFEGALTLARDTGHRSMEIDLQNRLGFLYQKTGRMKKALETYELALSLSREDANPAGEDQALSWIVRISQFMGRHSQALKLCETRLASVRAREDRFREISWLNNLAQAYKFASQPREALKYFRELTAVAKELGDATWEIAGINETAQIFKLLREPREALDNYRLMQERARQTENPVAEVNALNAAGQIYQATGRKLLAIDAHERALALATEKGLPVFALDAIKLTAFAYSVFEQPEAALEYFHRLQQEAEQAGHRRLVVSALQGLAQTHQFVGLWSQAFEINRSLASLAKESGQREAEISALNTVALTHFADGQNVPAISTYGESLAVARGTEMRSSEMEILSRQGQVLQADWQMPEALGNYQEVHGVASEIEFRWWEINGLQGSAQVYSSLGQRTKALELYNQALAIAQESGNKPSELIILNGIASVYEVMEQTEQAIDTYQTAFDQARECGEADSEDAALFGLRRTLEKSGQGERLGKLLDLLLKEARDREDKAREFNLLHAVAQLRLKDDLLQALELFKASLKIALDNGNRALEIPAQMSLAQAYQVTGKPDHAVECYQRAIALGQGNHLSEINARTALAQVLMQAGKLPQAREQYERALQIARADDNRIQIVNILNQRAQFYISLRETQAALEDYGQALTVARAEGFEQWVDNLLYATSQVYWTNDRREEAFRVYEEELAKERVRGKEHRLTALLNNLAEYARLAGKNDEAIERYTEALAITRGEGNQYGVFYCINGTALSYEAKGEFETALEKFEEACQLMRETGEQGFVAQALGSKARVFLSLKRYEESLAALDDALVIYRARHDKAGEAFALSASASVLSLYLNRRAETATRLDEARAALSESGFQQTSNGWTIERMEEVSKGIREVLRLRSEALTHIAAGNYAEALSCFEQAVDVEKRISNPVGETAALVSVAMMLNNYMERKTEAVNRMERAVAVCTAAKMEKTTAGATLEQLQQTLDAMKSADGAYASIDGVPARFPSPNINSIIKETVTALKCSAPERERLRSKYTRILQDNQFENLSQEAEFINSLVALLDGKSAQLAPTHTYAGALCAIKLAAV